MSDKDYFNDKRYERIYNICKVAAEEGFSWVKLYNLDRITILRLTNEDFCIQYPSPNFLDRILKRTPVIISW
jgi:hypothetical protein